MLWRTASSSLSRIINGTSFGRHTTIRSSSSELGNHLAFTTKVDNVPIHCIKVGNGPHNIFLLTGVLCTATSHFMPQLTGLDRDLFTIYAWDPPGYGKSRPPNRTWTSDFYYRDAATAAGLLKALDLKETSLFGWSYGSLIALTLTIQYPQLVNRLAVSGANAYYTEDMIERFKAYSNIDRSGSWKRELFDHENSVEIQEQRKDYVNAMVSSNDRNMIRDRIHEIKNPTLIFYGEKDTLISSEHPHFLLSQISGAQIVSWPEGKHDLHLKYAQDFNKVLTGFLTK